MATLIVTVLFCALGFSLWLGVLRLQAIYEQRTPRVIQDKLYKVTKNFPRLVFDGLFSLFVWSGLGALTLELILYPFGADGFLPDVSWASGVVIGTLVLFALSFWSSPERSEVTPPRGRDLKKPERSGSSIPQKATTPSRGRTIRSYQDIK